MKSRHWPLVLVLAVVLGCKSESQQVVVYTSVDQVFSEPIFREFERKTGLEVRAVFDTEETKSTGVLNRLIAEAPRPQADVFWSGDPARPNLLMRRGLAEPYVSAAAQARQLNLAGTWSACAARARVLLVNRDRVAASDVPRTIRDLADARWRGRTAIANPLFGTTTMHVAALFLVWGASDAKKFLSDLKANDVKIASSNGEVKRLVVAGDVAFGLTDTDDANEALKAGAPVLVVYPDQDGIGTLVMPTSVVLMRRRPHDAPGRKLVDYLVSAEVEKRLAAAAAYMPLRTDVPTPRNVRKVTEIRAMNVDYGRVAAEMERIVPWLRAWAAP